jgi:hypothetical protein
MNRLLTITLGLVLVAGCKPKPQPVFDADARSGPDGKRNGARTLRPNSPMADSVDYQGQDATDWYMVQLPGKPGVLTTEISWSNDKSDIGIDVFDDAGTQLAASAPSPGAKTKTLLAKIDKVPGVYYIRVSAPNKTDGSPYTLTAKWVMPEEPKPEPVAEEPPPPEKKPKKEKVAHEPKPVIERDKEPKQGDSVQGRVVSAYAENGGLALQIDKGSAAGLKVGMHGQVLSGSSGEDPLDGGEFEVTQIVGPNKCLAWSKIKSIGKNTRVVIAR